MSRNNVDPAQYDDEALDGALRAPRSSSRGRAVPPTRDTARPLKPYGDAFQAGDKVPIPELDLPAGTPDWMRLDDGWADRQGTGLKKRRAILVTVPRAQVL